MFQLADLNEIFRKWPMQLINKLQDSFTDIELNRWVVVAENNFQHIFQVLTINPEAERFDPRLHQEYGCQIFTSLNKHKYGYNPDNFTDINLKCCVVVAEHHSHHVWTLYTLFHIYFV